MTDVITLIRQDGSSVDNAGDRVISEISREVFCRLESIGQKEFYQANALGLQPEIKFVLSDYFDYQGEKLISYDSRLYSVLRTFRKGNEIEIICTREVNKNEPSEIGR